jgi:hypothetical protein
MRCTTHIFFPVKISAYLCIYFVCLFVCLKKNRQDNFIYKREFKNVRNQ